MARIRSIHPGLFTDEGFMSLSDAARMFLLGIWTEADDQGVFEWKPLTLKARLRPVNNDDPEALLAELVDHCFVERFEHDGKRYGAVRNFRRYQRPKKPNASHPLPDELRTYVGLSADDVEEVPNQFPTKGEKSPQMEDGGGKREKDKSSIDEEFEVWYPRFPKHVGRGQALKAYRSARKKTDAQTLLDGIERYKATKPEYADWCNPATWLNGERWLDEATTEPDEPPVQMDDAAREKYREKWGRYPEDDMPEISKAFMDTWRNVAEVIVAKNRHGPIGF